MTDSPHSVQDDFAALRAEAEWRIPHVRDELNAGIDRIEEQLEAAQERLAIYETPGWINPVQKILALQEQLEAAEERLAWAARLLRYPDGGDQFSIDCRNWLNDYYAAFTPASRSS